VTTATQATPLRSARADAVTNGMEGGRVRRPPPRATTARHLSCSFRVELLVQPPRCPGAVRSIRCRRARMRRRHCASWGPPAAGNCVESRSCAGPCIRSRCPRRAPGQSVQRSLPEELPAGARPASSSFSHGCDDADGTLPCSRHRQRNRLGVESRTPPSPVDSALPSASRW
jgi:hypothetical protein